MDNLHLAGSNKTPEISFDSTTGILSISGRSIPENSIEFYKPMLAWMEEYATSKPENTTLQIKLEYFNTSSSKCLLDIFKKLESIGGKCNVEWYYEQDDEDMLEAGEDYEAIVHVPFKMIGVEQL
ncbi:MAG: DUF1987 domain-containing protein [Bacteroidetes bacterium]|nr:DUF1987 domain-containing protein [Bacteroidota bacterium]